MSNSTHQMIQGDLTAVYSAPIWRPIICAISVVILISMSVVAGRRTPGRLSSWRHQQMSNLAVILAINSSLIFVALTTFTTLGLGTSRNIAVCTWTYYLCVFFYSQAKVFTAWFLIERARLVTAPLVPRLKNKLYLFNLALSSLWMVILIIMILSKHAEIRSDHECRIGMGAGPVAGVMTINAFLEFYYTSLFALPLYRGNWANPRLRRLAIRTCIAALLSVTSSLTNLSVLLVHDGHELSWLCTTTCSMDTVFCALVLVALTGKKDDRPAENKTAADTWREADLTSAEKRNKSRRASAVSAQAIDPGTTSAFRIRVDRPDVAEEGDVDEEARASSGSDHRSSVGSDMPVLTKDYAINQLQPTASTDK